MSPISMPPGFRFHPTDEELVIYYLKRKINGRTIELEIIPEIDLYKCEPWDLPGKSLLSSKDQEWFFFSPRDRKYPNGSRTNRATKAGYWKATGKDRKVNSQLRTVGTKKTLVYYRGRAPHGSRTNWVMHEYRLEEQECDSKSGIQDAYALCRIIKKREEEQKHGTKKNKETTNSEISTSSTCLYSDGMYDLTQVCNISSMENEYMSHEESFNFPVESSQFCSQYGPISYSPSKVEIVPPVEYLGNTVANDTDDMLRKIVALASASDNFNGDFNYLEEKVFGCNKIGESSWVETNIKEERLVENLRWVGVSTKALEKSFIEEQSMVVPIDDIWSYRRYDKENTHQDGVFTLENENETTSCPIFEMVKKVEVSHGMFVTTRQVTNTFFQELVPSQNVVVYINPTSAIECCHERSLKEEVHILKKINTFVESIVSKFVKPWTKLMYVVGRSNEGYSRQPKKGVRRKIWKKKESFMLKKLGLFLTIILVVTTMCLI